jgi:outer membrane protein OmpA-like peptidoglycan-associated protein/tetratricopeptide (TPR) repeat protein
MKNLIRHCTILLLLSLSIFSSIRSQQDVPFHISRFPNDPRGLKQALISIEKGDRDLTGNIPSYRSALSHFLDAHRFNGRNASLNFKIAHCYLHLPEKFKALSYLELAGSLNPGMGHTYTFSLARAYQYAMKFHEAIVSYERFLADYPGKNADTIAMVKQNIAACNLGIEFIKNPASHKIESMGERINSSFDEYVPLITADEYMLVFTAKKPHRKQKQINPYNMDFYEDIYISYFQNTQWTLPLRQQRPINKKKQNNASVHLTFDGQTIYTYSSKNNGDLYSASLSGERWGKPKPFRPVNTKEYSESHICFSYDGNTAYFVSDRPGGFGGLDIWYIEKGPNGAWGAATNMGAEINTPGNEDSPFIHPDNKTMYFSSDGHPGMGGFDIFETEWKDGHWSTPRNLRYPINGPDDDLFFILSANGMNAYFSSSRPGGFGGQDLYTIRPFNPERPKDTVPFKDFDVTLFVGLLIDASTQKPVGGNVEITDNASGEVVWNNLVNSVSGKFTLTLPTGKNYGIVVESDGYLFYSENFNMEKQIGFREVQKTIPLIKVAEGAKLVLYNVFFDFNSWTLLPNSRAELNRAIQLLSRYPKYKIQIAGHTDSSGSDEVNDRISQQRALAVSEYLKQQQFPSDRIVLIQGFGKRQPITGNDTPEGRAKNRRVEIQLLK